jgi:hypothetical protein
MAAVDGFALAAERLLETGDHASITDEELRRAMTAAVRLYAARAEATGTLPPPLDGTQVTATDIVVTICEMMRVADINMFDLNMWYGRVR